VYSVLLSSSAKKACAQEGDKTRKNRQDKNRTEQNRTEKKRKEKKRKEKKRKEKTVPLGINLMRSQVLHQAAQAQDEPNAVANCLSIRCSDLNSSCCSQVLTRVLKHGSPGLQLRGTDVMLSAIQHDPAPLRQFMRSQKDHELFHLLVRYFCICHISSDSQIALPGDGHSICFAVTSAHVVVCLLTCAFPHAWLWLHAPILTTV